MTMPCANNVQEKACVQVSIRLTPDVCIGPATTRLVGKPKDGPCSCRAAESCVFTFHQEIRVQIPVSIAADAEIAGTLIRCEAFSDEMYPMEE